MSIDEGAATLQEIGAGITVFVDTELAVGPSIWLGSPEAVIEFVNREDTADFIVVARGGTTTFLTPALVAGIKGIITLQGAPTSHLGIISREYGIPCLMSVGFTSGNVNERGEIIPPDGTILSLDISTTPRGRVMAPQDANLTQHTQALADAAPASENDAPADILRFANGVQGGSVGEKIMQSRMQTEVLTLSDESLNRDLSTAEVNDLLDYYGWNVWDILVARISEGESGLIPRQEYELLGVYMQWRLHPRWHRMITESVGVDGLREVGSVARKEIGTKVNPLHIWSSGVPTALGRGIAIALGKHDTSYRTEDLSAAMQFTRRLYRGMWADQGAMFTASRNYTAAILENHWLERFQAEKTVITDRDQRRMFQKFNGGTGITSFLLHFDNRCGVADSGPYPLPGGGWMLVRDHVLNDTEYPWATHVSDLPYAVTSVMFFESGEEIEKTLVDIGTMFTTPANYLKGLTGYAVYLKATEQTPMSDLVLLDEAGLVSLTQSAEASASRLYPQIAAMTERDKILAGARVYYTDFIAPIAKAAGTWDALLAEGFYDLAGVADEVYDQITAPGKAMELLPPHWGGGAGLHRI